MIAGLESVTEGTLRIGDRVVNDVEPKDRDIAMVFQSYALYPHMTVRRNIESPLVARKLPRRRRAGAPEAHRRPSAPSGSRRRPATLGLTELLDRKPAALSGGQRQRVALARAIVSRPRAFLMDEPLSNLDAKLRAKTRVDLVELHRRLATTFVYVTHDQVEAMTMADRIAVISEGRLQQVGPPQAVYERPHNLFVARFIGSPPMNTVARHHRRATATSRPSMRSAASASALERHHRRAAGRRGRRWCSACGPSTSSSTPSGPVTATVRAVEWLGHERLVVCDLAGHEIMVRQASGDAPVEPGDVLTLDADPAEVHLFDPDTTERLN